MTLQQLKYVVKVAEKGSINEASKELLISQPSLSNAIAELEKEIHTAIFLRTNRGVTVTNNGAEFLGYARQVLTQTDLLEARFLGKKAEKQRFCVSAQHYLFVANAFVQLVKEYGREAYDFALYETTTYDVIENVKTMFSELGVLYLSNFNEAVIRKLLDENDLRFQPLFCATPHVFLSKRHPLAAKASVRLEELEDYPRISFNQGQHNAFYFSEELFSTRTVKKNISVSDRAAVVNLIIGLNGYTLSSGVFPRELHGNEVISLPLIADEKMEIGVIWHRDAVLSEVGEKFYKALQNYNEYI